MTASISPTRGERLVIIGAGPSGLCLAVKLKKSGYSDFVILERESGVGGTWRRNTYPGLQCDLMAILYSFSFAVKADWSRPFAPQSEILEYMEKVAEDFGLLEHCRFRTTVRRLVWDDDDSRWDVELDDGEIIRADAVVSAIGMFNELAFPDIEGLDEFQGTMFHSARWPADHDLSGESVAVIGSAASAVQFVPVIVRTARQVHLFQRTANWVLPKADDPYTNDELAVLRSDRALVNRKRREIFEDINRRMLFSDQNVVQEAEARGLAAIEVVSDPEVRKKLRPNHPFGCKRPLFSNDYYPAFNRPNLELVTDPITRLTEGGVVTADGKERMVDTVILATGYETTKFLSALEVTGRNGIHINDAWKDGAQAHLGVMTTGFPNLFMMYGPNTNNGSILPLLEYQADYILRQLKRLRDENFVWIDVRAEAMERYNQIVQKAIADVAVWQGNCSGYYRTASGRVVTQLPFSMTDYRRRLEDYDPADFEFFVRRADRPSVDF